jgi:Transcriptional regulator
MHILKAAYQLFLSNNVEKVTISEIEKATKKIRGTIFYHFKDKQGIFEAVVNEIFFPLFEIPQDMVTNANSLPLYHFMEKYKSPEERIIDRTNEMFQIENAATYYYDFLSQAGKYYPSFKKQYLEVTNSEFAFLNSVIKKNRKSKNQLLTEKELTYIIMLLKTGIISSNEYIKDDLELNYNVLFKKISSHF